MTAVSGIMEAHKAPPRRGDDRGHGSAAFREAVEWKARAESLEEALRELVRLKDLKDAGEDIAWTLAEKDAAWQAARSLLSNHPKATE